MPTEMTFETAFLAEQDTQECASFLLALKHRSVTPDLDSSAEGDAAKNPLPSDKTKTKRQKISYDSDESKAPSLLDEKHRHSSTMTDDSDIESLIGDSTLVKMSDRHHVPDALFLAMAQMKVCYLTEADQVGCYKTRKIGFPGLSCKHCCGQPGFGRFFPSTLRSLAQTTTSHTIMKHVTTKCRYSPPEIGQTILELQLQQATQEAASSDNARPRYGSRKTFFQNIWGRIHNIRTPDDSSEDDSGFSTEDGVESAFIR